MLSTMVYSTGLFALMILLGRLLLFIDQASLWMILIYFLLLLVIQKGYQVGSCKTIQKRDFLFALIIVCFCIVVRMVLGIQTSFDESCYYYLACFLSISGFASSIRFKSLL